MATLVLGFAGQALGAAILGPTAFSLFGAAVSGASIGGAIGGIIGQYVDNAFLLPGDAIRREGPRLSQISLLASQEGAPIPRLFGRGRIAGQIIWASRFLETATTRTESVGGKGGGGRKVSETTYAYSVSLAIGLCEGPIVGIGRVWADGTLLDATGLAIRVHNGTEDQSPDELIEAIEGVGNVPSYKGLAYVVFEDLPLADFGNRVPQLQFEVFRPLEGTDAQDLEQRTRAVVLTPGSGEFVYATEGVFRDLGGGRSQAENLNTSLGKADVLVALDQVMALLPNLTTVTVVVAWYGDDLRCGSCTVRPGTEFVDKTTYPLEWAVNGATRSGAHLVTRDEEGRPNYGGTPSDASLVMLISEIKARGLEIILLPMLLLDIAPGNARPDPYDPEAEEQPPFPWRGRLTLSLAPGVEGSPDKTAAAGDEVSAFFGSADLEDFAVDSSAKTVTWTGSAQWSYRRFLLHYAHLAHVAGGVDGFLIGSELRGLTTLRSAPSTYPAVAELKSLAGAVRLALGPGTQISYAADWAEYFGHQPADGSGDVHFHLDPLWSDAAIDAVGIDYYVPLTDWRDGGGHADAVAGYTSIYGVDYLQGGIEGGEGFDWFYASDGDRLAQVRSAISDGAHGKPWVFRYKDIRSWWLNAHYDRPGGAESSVPTDWVPQSKPIWLTEIGCPAVDKGSNQPNVFVDGKSVESRLPHFSRGERDDLIQRRALESILGHWHTSSGNNPISDVYGGPMIPEDRVAVWTYDARPFPDFPSRESVWSDAPSWRRGHWISGRLGAVPLGALVRALSGEGGADFVDTSGLGGLVQGYVLDRSMTARAAIEPLASAFAFDAVESDGFIVFRERAEAARVALAVSDLVAQEEGTRPFEVTRAQESELPAAARISYVDLGADYRVASAEARKLTGSARSVLDVSIPLALDLPEATAIAERLLQGAWAGRERAKLTLPPSRAAVEPGDIIDLTASGRVFSLAVTRLSVGSDREVEAVAVDTAVLDSPRGPERTLEPPEAVSWGRAELHFLDLPALDGGGEQAGYLAVAASPWPGRIAVHKAQGTEGFSLVRHLERSAVTGRLTADLYPGPLHRFDRANEIYVELFGGGLASASRQAVLAGANACAIAGPDGWEILQFEDAVLIGADVYRLSGLLRGQLGTERVSASPAPAGSVFVLLNEAVAATGLVSASARLEATYAYGPARRPIADISYRTVTHTFAGIPSRPLSPAHVRAVRGAGGDITITWVRRTRTGGDAWEADEVPLGEASERYEVDVYSGPSVVRTLTASTSTCIYSFAEQSADFGGGAPSPLGLSVFQVGQSFGRGRPATAMLTLG